MPPLEHYGGDQIEDIGDVENEPPINNGSTEEVTDGNRSVGDNEDIIEDYEDEEQEPQLRKSSRIPKPQTKYPATEFVLLTDGGEPESYEETLMDNHKEEWLKVVQEEIQSLPGNSTYKLVGISKMSLCFGSRKPKPVGYTDADMAGDIDYRKSTYGFLITYSGGVVFWQLKLQKCIALSTTEAEFIAITEACKEMLWMKQFLHELGQEQHKYVVHCDSQSAIHLSKNSSFHSRSKHIDVRYHWIRDMLDSKQLQLEKIHIDDNCSDMITKSLPKEKYEFCKRDAELFEPSIKSEGGN
ncbi:hypothetical protein KIW84_056689 [Lathyrus oleraceus]|uniref:Retrovirus-related Pol polyprotein from transposon TNT 1-94 n=1 Tax=Pisum sativum TaxID=3888 RepID=A0A9D4X168_PEA|nr:hypothetical protein KIW84_056689 [Pisum sativum]